MTRIEELLEVKEVREYETLRQKCAQEAIKELYEQDNIDGLWSVSLDDLTEEEFPFEVEEWMYIYAMSLQPKEVKESYQAEHISKWCKHHKTTLPCNEKN